MWDNEATVARSEIVGHLHSEPTSQSLQAAGFSLDQVRGVVERLVSQESLTLATNHIFLLSAIIFACAASMIWLSPRPKRIVGPGAGH